MSVFKMKIIGIDKYGKSFGFDDKLDFFKFLKKEIEKADDRLMIKNVLDVNRNMIELRINRFESIIIGIVDCKEKENELKFLHWDIRIDYGIMSECV